MAKQLPPSAYEALAESRGYRWLGPYTGNVLVPTEWECQHGHRWFTVFHNAKRYNCPYCAGTASKTEADYRQLAAQIGLAFIGPVPKNTEQATTWQCERGHAFRATYQRLKHGDTRCQICSKRIPKTADDYQRLGEAVGLVWDDKLPATVKAPTFWRCPEGHVFARSWNAMQLAVQGLVAVCVACKHESGMSHPESLIANTLTALCITFETQKRFKECRIKKKLPFDFYLPDHQALIEFHGEQHYTTTGYGGGRISSQAIQRRDTIKSEFAQSHGYKLFVIPYTISDVQSEIATIITELLSRH